MISVSNILRSGPLFTVTAFLADENNTNFATAVHVESHVAAPNADPDDATAFVQCDQGTATDKNRLKK